MTRDKLVAMVFSFSGLLNSSFAQHQEPSLRRYIVITFEDTYKASQHGTQSYYWIVPEDSLKSSDDFLSRLFVKNFSKNNLIECCNGNDIDPFLIAENTNYIFDSAYLKSVEELEQIVTKHRKKLQSVNKKWQSGQREYIEIFATPVSGKFCSSNFHSIGQQHYGYKGKVYIPYSSFTYIDEFWKSAEATFLSHRDFSKLKFDIIPYQCCFDVE